MSRVVGQGSVDTGIGRRNTTGCETAVTRAERSGRQLTLARMGREDSTEFVMMFERRNVGTGLVERLGI